MVNTFKYIEFIKFYQVLRKMTGAGIFIKSNRSQGFRFLRKNLKNGYKLFGKRYFKDNEFRGQLTRIKVKIGFNPCSK